MRLHTMAFKEKVVSDSRMSSQREMSIHIQHSQEEETLNGDFSHTYQR